MSMRQKNDLQKGKNLVVDVEALRSFSANRWPDDLGTTHGLNHWDRVAMFGERLCQEEADLNVILAFAYLHDSERVNNGEDLYHGYRASMLIDSIRHTMLRDMSDEQIRKLKSACELHTIKRKTGDLTIDICFDADRMDLLRVGIKPQPERMATGHGAELVSNPDFCEWYKLLVNR